MHPSSSFMSDWIIKLSLWAIDFILSQEIENEDIYQNYIKLQTFIDKLKHKIWYSYTPLLNGRSFTFWKILKNKHVI